MAELRDIARERGWKLNAVDRAECVAELDSRLADPTEIARAVTTLTPSMRDALRAAFLAEDGSGVTPSGMALAMTALQPSPSLPPLGPCPRAMEGKGDPTGEQPAVKPVEAAGFLSDLARRGLLLTWRDSYHHISSYWLPWEIQRHIPPLPGWCPKQQGASACNAEQRCTSRDPGGALALLEGAWQAISGSLRPVLRPGRSDPPDRRLATALQGWPYDEGELQRLLTNGRRRADLAQQVLSAPAASYLLDDTAMAAWPSPFVDRELLELVCRLLQELGLVEADGGRLRPLNEAWQRFQHRPVPERIRLVAHAYMSLSAWSELDVLLRRTPDLVLWHNGQFSCSYDLFRSRLSRMRHLVLRFLATAGEEGWCLLSDVEAALKSLWPDLASLLDTPPLAWGLARRDESGQWSSKVPLSWQDVQGQLLRLVLEGPLLWFGWSLLSCSGGHPVAVHLCGLADWVWDRPLAPPESDQPPAAVFAEGEQVSIVVRPGAVLPEALSFLGRIAVLQEATPGRMCYQLDLRTVHAAFEAGASPADLLDDWTRLLPLQPPPAAVGEILSDWWTRFGEVRLYEGFGLLEVHDDVLLRELEAGTSLSKRIVGRLSPRLVLVPEDQVNELLREFAERGYMPKAEGV